MRSPCKGCVNGRNRLKDSNVKTGRKIVGGKLKMGFH